MKDNCRTEKLVEELKEVQARLKEANIEYDKLYENCYKCTYSKTSSAIWDVLKGSRPYEFMYDRDFCREAKDFGTFLINLESDFSRIGVLEDIIDELNHRQSVIKTELGIY